MKKNVLDLFTYIGTYWEGKIYCLARDFNLLFSVDLQDGTTELIDVIPKEDILSNFICGIMTIWNEKIIFTPKKTKKIWIYDLISRQWDSAEIKDSDHCYDAGSIYQIYTYNDKIFLVGGGYPAILCLDLENNSCDYIEEPYKDMLTRHPEPDYMYFWYYGVQLENSLYLASCLDNYVLEFNMGTLEYHWIKVGDNSDTYRGIAWDGNNFWLRSQSGGAIIKWDGKETIVKFPLPDELKQHPEYIWGICYDGKQIILPATTHTNTILIDPQKNTLQIQKQQYTMYGRSYNGNSIVISQTTEGELSVKIDDSVQTYKITIDTDQLRQFYEDKNIPVFKGQTLYHEAPQNSLLSLENFLALTGASSQNKSIPDGQVGKAIWESIR